MFNTICQRILFAMMLALTANPALAFRCGHDLIVEGDHKIEVRASCGEPDDIELHTWFRHDNVLHYTPDRRWRTYIRVNVELWTYNMGPFRFIRRLRFENGILTDVKTLGRGFREK